MVRTRVSEGRYCPLSGWEQVQDPTDGDDAPLGLTDPSADEPLGAVSAEHGPLPGFDPGAGEARWGGRSAGSVRGAPGGAVGLCVDCWTWHGGSCEGGQQDARSGGARAA